MSCFRMKNILIIFRNFLILYVNDESDDDDAFYAFLVIEVAILQLNSIDGLHIFSIVNRDQRIISFFHFLLIILKAN